MGAKVSKANAPTENGGSELGAPTAAWGKKSTANGTISKTNKTNSPPSPATLTTPSSPPALLEGGNLNEILVVSESSESLDSHAVKPPATSTVVAPAKDDWSSMMGAAPISNNVNHSTYFTKKSSSATMKLQQHHTAAADSTTPASQQFGQSQNNVRTSTSRNTGNIISSATKGSGGEVYSKPLSGKDDGIGGVDSAYDADIKLEENGSLGHISCSSDYNEEVEVETLPVAAKSSPQVKKAIVKKKKATAPTTSSSQKNIPLGATTHMLAKILERLDSALITVKKTPSGGNIMESSLKSLSLSVADDDDDEDNNNDEDLPDYREATESSLSKLDLAANNDDSDEEDDHNFTNSNSRRPSSNTISGYSVNPHSILPPLFPVTQQQQLSCNPSVEVGGSSGITLLRRPRLQHELSSASMDSIISNKSKHSSKASTDDDDDDDESGGGSSSKLQLKTTSSTSSFNTDDNIDLSASSLNDTVDLESKKKIIRCLNELKRLLCREGYISNDSTSQRILFPQQTSVYVLQNASIFIKCLKIAPALFCDEKKGNFDLPANLSQIPSSLITAYSRNPLINILLYLTSQTASDKGSANLLFFVKKGVGNYLMKWMSSVVNSPEKQDDDNVLLDIITLVVRIGKNDPKLPTYARLLDCIHPLSKLIQSWYISLVSSRQVNQPIKLNAELDNPESRMWGQILLGFQTVKLFCKNERNIPILLKTGLAEVTSLIILEFAKIPDSTNQATVEFQEVDPSMNTILQVFGDMAKGRSLEILLLLNLNSPNQSDDNMDAKIRGPTKYLISFLTQLINHQCFQKSSSSKKRGSVTSSTSSLASVGSTSKSKRTSRTSVKKQTNNAATRDSLLLLSNEDGADAEEKNSQSLSATVVQHLSTLKSILKILVEISSNSLCYDILLSLKVYIILEELVIRIDTSVLDPVSTSVESKTNSGASKSTSTKSALRTAVINLAIQLLRRLIPPIELPFMSHMYLRNFKLPTNPSSQTGVIAEDKKEDMSRFFSELADSSDLATLGRPPAPPTQSPFCNLFYPNPSQYPSVPETKLPFDENYDEHIGLQKQQKKLTPAYIKKLSIDCILKELNPPSDSLDVGKSNNGQLVYHAHRNIRISESELVFDSSFESGNLQMAVKVAPFEYSLILETDVNAPLGRHNQWFFFSVRNMKGKTPYQFTIINLSKPNSQFNFGMQPVFYSSVNKTWSRIGEKISYYKNHFAKPLFADKASDDPADDTYCSLTFTISFPYDNDTGFIAYHYPYSYTYQQAFLDSLKENINVNRQLLCYTLAGNRCDLLTITANDEESRTTNPIASRHYIFLSSRVHPGESNASHITHGLINFLVSDDEQAIYLRKTCVFKIVPMLNPDGVYYGCHRTSMAGWDLNRQWRHPEEQSSPTIYWSKALLKWMCGDIDKKPLLCCDFHGHSRKKNIFMFGNGKDSIDHSFTGIVANTSSIFDLSNCTYHNEPNKEGTGRVVWWRELNINRSYTLESSYCGANVGDLKAQQFRVEDLRNFGRDYGKAIAELVRQQSQQQPPLQK